MMKRKVVLISAVILLWLFHLPAKAPEYKCLYIIASKPAYPLNIEDPVLRAFVALESNFDPFAVNKRSKARGILQILPPMIKEVNRILEEYNLSYIKYTWDDAFNIEKSINIWYIVQTYHNPDYNVKEACKIWFGRGKQYNGMTWRGYYKLLQKFLPKNLVQ